MVFLTRLGDITTDDIAGMLPMMFIIMIGICVISLIIIKAKDSQNDSKPILGMNAKIVDMMREEPGQIAIVIWVLFQTEDGNRVKLSCSAKNHFVVGDKGFLKWQGSRLISFERENME